MQTEIARLQQLKESFPERWTEAMQKQLDKMQEELNPKQEVPETQTEEQKPTGFVPPKGQEHLAHLKIVKGQRFNPETGAEISKPYIQTFTRSEYRVFESAAQRLGYKIVEVLHKPF